MKDENLSEKILEEMDIYEGCINVKDVKEFIKKDWKLFEMYLKHRITYGELIQMRNKLAGEKLIK